MVLEDATAGSSVGFTGDAPSPSDPDPFSTFQEGASQPPSRIELDLTQLPHPVPILGPVLGFTQQRLGAHVQQAVSDLTGTVRRPLEKTEIDAVAYHIAKGRAIASYGFPIGAIGGIWRAETTRSTLRYPFWKVDVEKVDLNKFGPLRGPLAVAARHTARRAAYFFVGGYVGKWIVTVYAATVTMTGMNLDQRMRDVFDTSRKYAIEEAKRRSASRGEGPPMPGAGATNPSRPSDSSWPSPTSGRRESTPSYGGAASQQHQQQYSTPSSEPSSSSSSSELFGFDDASPTAGNEPMQTYNEPSAWERLRRGPTSSSGPTSGDRSSESPSRQRNAWESRRRAQEQEDRQGSTVGDRFAFTSADEDRKREREQAQGEFDAKLERERKGEDFDSGERKWR